MRRNLQTLGIALLVAFAISAVAASGASAVPLFHSEAEDTKLTGSQGAEAPNILTTDKGEMKCQTVKFVGKWSALTTTTLTLKPEYDNCKMDGVNAFVILNGCAYLFHLGDNTETLEAKMDIECPDGEQLVINAGFCTITIPPQAGLQQVTFTNDGVETTRSIVADMNISGFHYEEHGAECGSNEQTTENGAYTGRITVRGENEALEHVGIWVD